MVGQRKRKKNMENGWTKKNGKRIEKKISLCSRFFQNSIKEENVPKSMCHNEPLPFSSQIFPITEIYRFITNSYQMSRLSHSGAPQISVQWMKMRVLAEELFGGHFKKRNDQAMNC